MTAPGSKNLAASVHQRLLNKARADGRPFNELLQYFAIERFLYRLAQSPYQDRFVLKGALIFTAWGAPNYRSTRDLDLLAYTSSAVNDVVAIVKSICVVEVAPDGLIFDPDSVVGERIREQADYAGVRVRFKGGLGNARINLQVDLGFADVVTPGPESVEYPSLLDMPRPQLRGYPRETVVAEKSQALVALGQANTRMKDFYDLWLLSRTFKFDADLLAEAIVRTFGRRDTDVPVDLPIGLTNEFAQSKQSQWQAFLRTGRVKNVPEDFVSVVVEIREFLWPVMRRARV